METERLRGLYNKKQFLEEYATIPAQWFQSHNHTHTQIVSYSHIKASLDNIAREVLICLREKHPVHSIFSMSAENFSYWENNNINESHWEKEEGLQILNALEKYIFDIFQLNELKELKYVCIDYVSYYKLYYS